ncbi:hypothetical protein Aph01nite_65310 [Acrocarpospora phusangensis]|uniref:Uncharacterized protein n=1 Tax=Acrocarpospora phusangensis TaxID=1070424 RepID=A0A919QI06_9ACTN|nr:hypothetical protein [Acrocarpospora phusangensis]GIH28221.1 hypothetical protein Aph01nite_65310 [Acrocarpospora phusangensis]
MKAFLNRLRGLRDRPRTGTADGRPIGLGLATAMRNYYSAHEAERHLRRWAAEHPATTPADRSGEHHSR